MSNAIPLKAFDLEELKSRINPAYENIQGTESYERRLCVEEIERLKAELERPNHEPAAYLTIDSTGKHHVHLDQMSDSTMKDWNITAQYKLYTSPPARKPLSDDEIDSIKFYSIPSDFDAALRRFARAIEKAHGIGADHGST